MINGMLSQMTYNQKISIVPPQVYTHMCLYVKVHLQGILCFFPSVCVVID